MMTNTNNLPTEQEEIVKATNETQVKIKKLIILALIFHWANWYVEREIYRLCVQYQNLLPKKKYLEGIEPFNGINPFGEWATGMLSSGLNWWKQAQQLNSSVAKWQEIAEKTQNRVFGKDLSLDLAINPPYQNKSLDSYFGEVNIEHYPRKIRKGIEDIIAKEPTLADSKDSLFSVVDMAVRHKGQLEMIEKAYKSGKDLFWASAHHDCSKRCFPYQGQLFSLSLPSKTKKGWTGKVVEGHRIYSFKYVTNQVDRYGWKNNIFVGFNCRHFLKEYTNGSKAPNGGSEKENENNRKLRAIQRRMEREIRTLKNQARVYRDLGDRKAEWFYNKQAKALFNKYVAFSTKHGLPYYPFRCGY